MDPVARTMYIANLMQTKGMTYAQAENYLNNPNNATAVEQGLTEINRQAKAPSITSGSNDMPNAVTGPSFNMANYDFINPNATQKPNVLNQQPTLYSTNRVDVNPNTGGVKSMNDFQTKEEWVDYRNKMGFDPTTAAEDWDEQNAGDNRNTPQGPMGGYNQGASGIPLWYPGGSDISTELFTMGRGIGAAKGAKGKNAAIIAGGGAALFDITRNVLAGVGYEKSNQYVENEYRKNQYGTGSRDYNRQRQYKNSNAFGEMDFEQGGMFGNFTPDLISDYKRKFEEGGEQEDMEQQSMQPQEQEEEEGQPQDQMQQVQMMIAQALQQGQEPQMIVQALIDRGVPQDQAVQMVAQVAQQMQQQNMEQSEEEPEMKRGGNFKHSVGDYIEFKVDGKIKKGKIKKIENGKIFL